MRIAILAWETMHGIAVGGVAVHATELAAALERKGEEVHVFTRAATGLNEYDRIDGVHYHRCPFGLNPSFVDEIQDFNRALVYRLHEVEDYGGPFDIIHAHDWLTSNAMVWFKQRMGRKGVFTIHSTEYGRCGNQFCNGTSGRIRDHERHGAWWADRVITVSNALRHEVGWMYEVPPWKLTTIHNGVHAERYNGFIEPGPVRARFGIGPMDPMVLFVGRMCVQKGPDILVEAIPMVLHHHPEAKFVFVGDGEQRWQCEDLARRLGVAHATRFLGYHNGGLLVELFKACDVVAVPSRNEPFGIVVLEAWSAGKPVIVTHNGGPEEFVWHWVNGLKTDAHPESVAWGVGSVFQNFDHARWMGGNGRVAAETAFNWDRIARETVNAYYAIE